MCIHITSTGKANLNRVEDALNDLNRLIGFYEGDNELEEAEIYNAGNFKN